MSTIFVTINDFMSLPVFFYRSLGVDLFESKSSKAISSLWLYAKLIIHMLNINFVLGLEITFVCLAFKNTEHFVEACMVMCYIFFVIVGECKISSILWQKSKLKALICEMEALFPSAAFEEQRQYQVYRYHHKCRLFSKGFTGLYLLLLVTYCLYAFLQLMIQKWIWHLPNAKMDMPFTPISPWHVDKVLGFSLMYAVQVLAGYTSTAIHISSDILVYALVIQVVMHFDYLSRTLKELQVQSEQTNDSYAKDLQLLQKLISYHSKLLRLTDVMNNVIGLPMLINFLASSLTVCGVGFQMTLNLSPQQTCKLGVFLISAIVEIFLICYFSDLLIVASSNVAQAVYEMNWIELDPRIKKMLLLMAVRSQKPVSLKATIFLNISMQTMTTFLQMTYRFFCVIRTMYQ